MISAGSGKPTRLPRLPPALAATVKFEGDWILLENSNSASLPVARMGMETLEGLAAQGVRMGLFVFDRGGLVGVTSA